MTNLKEIRSEIEELKKYREVILKLKENNYSNDKDEKEKPKVKKLEVIRNEHN